MTDELKWNKTYNLRLINFNSLWIVVESPRDVLASQLEVLVT